MIHYVNDIKLKLKADTKYVIKCFQNMPFFHKNSANFQEKSSRAITTKKNISKVLSFRITKISVFQFEKIVTLKMCI